MGGQAQVGFDANAAYKNEREALAIVAHEWVAEKAERTLLGDSYPDSSSETAFNMDK